MGGNLLKTEEKGLRAPIFTNKYQNCFKIWPRLSENAAVFISELCFERNILYKVAQMLVPGTKVSSIKILHTVTIKMIHFCAFSEARSPNTSNFCPLFTRTLNMHLNYKCTTRPPYSKSKCPQQLKSCKYSRNRKHIRILPSSYYSKVVYFFFQKYHKKKRLQKQKSVVGNA